MSRVLGWSAVATLWAFTFAALVNAWAAWHDATWEPPPIVIDCERVET